MRHLGRRGFTLVELLIVVGIIVLLATILLPMVIRVQLQARRTAMAADLQVISQALEAYRSDFGDYPRVNRYQHQTGNLPVNASNGTILFAVGAQVLCWALVAPGNAAQDGADGPGFRLRGVTGPVKGPYLPPDRFLIGLADGLGVIHAPGTIGTVRTTNFDDTQDVLADRSNSPILYFPAYKGGNPASSFVAATFQPQEAQMNIPPCLSSTTTRNFSANPKSWSTPIPVSVL